ncbi:thiamine pyrophosphate-dependent dehydrogenase E1 component subunit alpha [Streptomyces paradoxus]|uniref:thiamine pyrophosphate-dependent dehydrogenase E1 component subunit alpha n=1 Tax=Streptomyces paradoxus TaxID=66375 RepID=UPI00362858F2
MFTVGQETRKRPAEERGGPHGDHGLLRRLFTTMCRIRAFEEEALALRTSGEIPGVIHPYIGHEAIATGMCSVLDDDDWVGSYYRSHGHAIAHGCAQDVMMAELFGKDTGCCRGKGGSMHLMDLGRRFLGGTSIVAAGIPHAAGAALAAQMEGRGVVLSFFGEGATGSGVFHETMNIASAQSLPVVFVCENNTYQDHTRTEQVAPSTDFERFGLGHLMESQTVDGNDVMAVRRAATEAVEHARSGDGPVFIQAMTYLTYYHSQLGTPPLEYRPADEVAHWAARDPILLARRELVAAGVPAAELDRVEDQAAQETAEAVEFARRSPEPDLQEATTDVYVD